MSTYSKSIAASSPQPIITCSSVLPPEIAVHDAYIGGHFRRMKFIRKASGAAEYKYKFGLVECSLQVVQGR